MDETTADYSEYEATADLYTYWIEQMDPYVSEQADGTYLLDWDGFYRSIAASNPEEVRYFAVGGQPTKDATVIAELRDGIPIANAAILAAKVASPQSAEETAEVLGSHCWNYWWGRRCCYWGNTGWVVAGIINAGGSIPPWGWLLWPWRFFINYYMAVYSGFCANSSWAWPSAIWITRP